MGQYMLNSLFFLIYLLSSVVHTAELTPLFSQDILLLHYSCQIKEIAGKKKKNILNNQIELQKRIWGLNDREYFILYSKSPLFSLKSEEDYISTQQLIIIVGDENNAFTEDYFTLNISRTISGNIFLFEKDRKYLLTFDRENLLLTVEVKMKYKGPFNDWIEILTLGLQCRAIFLHYQF